MTAAAEFPLLSDGPPARRASATSDAMTIDEVAGVIRALPHGGIDDTTRSFELPPAVRATVAPVLGALRWGAVLFGMVFASVDAAVDGEMKMVAALSVALFLATWRTVQPNRLASSRPLDRVLIYTDMVFLSLAAGVAGGFQSPFVFCVMAVAIIGAFGWGLQTGVGLVVLGSAGLLIAGQYAPEDPLNGIIESLRAQSTQVVLVSMAVAVGLAAFARVRLLDAERRRLALAGQLESLNEANDLLQMLNQVARTLPNSLNLREATSSAGEQLSRSFDADVICLLVLDESSQEWVPQITEGCVVHPSTATEDLPSSIRSALGAGGPTIVRHFSDGDSIEAASKCGLYTELKARDQVVGLLGLEDTKENAWSDRDLSVLAGLSDVLAISIDNARWFGRLRTLGADEERTRIARDLHDRLGQWLTYINFELERIITAEGGEHDELHSLHSDVQSAIDELRETLRQLRSGVSEDEPLETVSRELIQRFADRTDTAITFEVASPGEHLPVPVENELLRILQEALNNIDKHAKASNVHVRWAVADGAGVLSIVDDGRGFSTENGVRESAYGLVGMRERADVAGARLDIKSAKGEGTRITVTAGNQNEENRR